jgi:hypothetical protein
MLLRGYTGMRMRLAVLLMATTACSGLSDDPGTGERLAFATNPTWLAAGSETLYFTSSLSSTNNVYSVDKAGGTPHLVATTTVAGPLAATGTTVYWVANDGGKTSVMIARDNEAPRSLGDNPNGINGYSLRNMVTDGDNAYFSDISGSVWKASASASSLVEVMKADTSVASLALDGDGTLWVATLQGAKHISTSGMLLGEVTLGSLPDELACDADAVYASFSGSGDDDGKIVRAPKTGGSVQTLVSNLVLPSSLTRADDGLYVTTGNLDAAIRRVPTTGGSAEALAVGERPTALVVDESFVYWTDPPSGEVRRVAR